MIDRYPGNGINQSPSNNIMDGWMDGWMDQSINPSICSDDMVLVVMLCCTFFQDPGQFLAKSNSGLCEFRVCFSDCHFQFLDFLVLPLQKLVLFLQFHLRNLKLSSQNGILLCTCNLENIGVWVVLLLLRNLSNLRVSDLQLLLQKPYFALLRWVR